MRLSIRSSRSLLAVGSLVLAAVAGGCGSGEDGANAVTMKRVGLMHVGTDHTPCSLDGMKERLAELGWTEGKSINLIWKNLEPEQADTQAKAFVAGGVDVIVAFEDQSIEAARKATARRQERVPVVFLHPLDPEKSGLVQSLDRPGGNLTGVFGARDLVAKQLERYRAVVPGSRRLLTLAVPDEKQLAEARAAAAQLRPPLQLEVREASSESDLRRIFRSLRPGEVDGVFLLSPKLRLNHSAVTLELAAAARLPVQAHRREWVEQGALFSYGIDLRPIGRLGARYVDDILRGASPEDLGVEEYKPIEFAINLETAARLGIRVPEEMIDLADWVYTKTRPTQPSCARPA